MGSPFNTLARTLLAPAVNALMGETMRLLPRKAAADVNAAAAPDPDRTETLFTGVFFDPRIKPQMSHAYDVRADKRPGVASTGPYVDVMPTELAAGLVVRRGDVVEQVDSGQRWRVMDVIPSKVGRSRLQLNFIG